MPYNSVEKKRAWRLRYNRSQVARDQRRRWLESKGLPIPYYLTIPAEQWAKEKAERKAGAIKRERESRSKPRRCLHCRRMFDLPRVRHCSDVCRRMHRAGKERDRLRAKGFEERAARRAFIELGLLPKYEPPPKRVQQYPKRPCAVCGASVPKNQHAYCSAMCRSGAALLRAVGVLDLRCRVCGEPLGNRRRTLCSDKCAQLLAHDLYPDRAAMDARRKRHGPKRRARASTETRQAKYKRQYVARVAGAAAVKVFRQLTKEGVT